MGIEQLLNDLKRSHEGLQHLHVEATEGNLNIILDALTTLRKAHAVISILTKSEEVPQKVQEVGDEHAS